MTELEQKFIQARRKAIAVEYAHLNDMQQQGVMTTDFCRLYCSAS